ncbi:MAG TPA: site-specific DNA-methyltransferase [Chthonomonadales bacterium]|nr:site-specific DNA-methyltransferase [Chthonomonadales bacterium]
MAETRSVVYRTALGEACCGDSRTEVAKLASGTVNAIVTSPPFALLRKKPYGNESQSEYVDWFMSFAVEFRRVLRDDGSLVVEIGGAWLPGQPVRSIYQFELLVRLVRDGGFALAQEFYWHNTAKLPGPAQWVNIERVRVKDSVSTIWWLSKTTRPSADNRAVLRPYGASHRRLMATGRYNRGARPSGHDISGKFGVDNGGAIPPNLLEVANTSSADQYQEFCRREGLPVHPARFPAEIPSFFIRFLTRPGDLVLDPFAGSNVTGAVAEQLGRRWLAFDTDRRYLRGSVGRFAGVPDLVVT